MMLTASGCGFINSLRAKNSLNEGVREFNKGKYQAAQQKFEYALRLNPDNANAQLFFARAINARFDQNLTEELGIDTLKAYETIIQHSKDDPKAVDQALAFRAKVYEQLSNIEPSKADHYKEKQREALLERAERADDPRTKAAVYYTIGQGYWHECYHNTSKRYLRMSPGKQEQLPIPPEVQAKMRPLIAKGHEYLQKAIAVQPDYADAWIYEKLVYLEELKVEQNPARRKELETLANQAQDNYKKFHELQQQQEAEAAKQAT
jgi:hypothetical protein